MREEICPNCGALTLRSWNELNEDQKMIVERLPQSAEFTIDERKKHRFCTRCWFEELPDLEVNV